MKHAVESHAELFLDFVNLASAIVRGDVAFPSRQDDVILHNLNNAIHGNVQG